MCNGASHTPFGSNFKDQRKTAFQAVLSSITVGTQHFVIAPIYCLSLDTCVDYEQEHLNCEQ